MLPYEINTELPVYISNDTFSTIEQVETRNWNRRLSPQNMSIIFELVDVWHRRIDSTIQMIGSTNPIADALPDSNGIYHYEIQDNVGTIWYQYIMDERGNKALFIVNISFKLPWNINGGRLSIRENEEPKRLIFTESQLHKIIRESIKRIIQLN